MLRGEFCKVIGMNPNTFKTLGGKGGYPFFTRRTTAKEAGRTWSNYTAWDAAAMIAAMRLAGGQGLQWSECCDMMRGGKDDVGNVLPGYSQTGPTFCDGGAGIQSFDAYASGSHELFLVRAEITCKGGGDRYIGPRFNLYEGLLPSIIAAIERDISWINERANFDFDRVALASLISVNKTEAFRITFANMKDIDPDHDFKPEPDADQKDTDE